MILSFTALARHLHLQANANNVNHVLTQKNLFFDMKFRKLITFLLNNKTAFYTIAIFGAPLLSGCTLPRC